MKTTLTCLLAAGMLIIYSCSKDKDDTPPPPTTEGYTAKVDDLNFIGVNGRTKIDSAQPLIKLPKHIKLIANMGNDKGIFVAVELQNNKLQPGTYQLKPRSDGWHAAAIFYSEKLNQTPGLNYASYYFPKEQQDGQVVINTVTDSSIIGTFHGKVLTAFGQTTDTVKVITEGKIYIKF